MSENNICWVQRFSNFNKALAKLSLAIKYIKNDIEKSEKSNDSESKHILVDIIKEGLFHRFEYTHELAWNVMKDYADYQGNNLIGGRRDASRKAFQLQLISDGKLWMDMIESRNKSSHTYNDLTAVEIFAKIINEYYPAFLEFQKNMEGKITELDKLS